MRHPSKAHLSTQKLRFLAYCTLSEVERALVKYFRSLFHFLWKFNQNRMDYEDSCFKWHVNYPWHCFWTNVWGHLVYFWTAKTELGHQQTPCLISAFFPIYSYFFNQCSAKLLHRIIIIFIANIWLFLFDNSNHSDLFEK